jgi:hypothetical protein
MGHSPTARFFAAVSIAALSLILSQVPLASADSDPTQIPTSVQMDVFPDGGAINPTRADGSMSSISNPGSITISNVGTGAIAFQKGLSFDRCGECVPNDYWDYDLRKAPAGLYRFCGQIQPGDGFAGWSECQLYSAQGAELFHFRPGRNTPSGFVVPLALDPALIGQTIKVSLQTYSWTTAPRARGNKLGWKKRGPIISQLVTLQADQRLSVGRRLGNNRQVRITISFPFLSDASDQSPETKDGFFLWRHVSNCSDTIRGKVTGNLLPTLSRKALRKPDFRGVRSFCI